ncbi:hypothetical protein ARMGADRAFT_1012417, partial [Armillaria gallica]
MPVMTPPAPLGVFDDDDGWQDMPVVREDELKGGLDEEDQKRYHYVPSAKGINAANAIGTIDVDDLGNEWRLKIDHNENEYTRLRVREEDENDDVHLRTRYLFDEDKAMTPLSQMQATKNLLTEAQCIAFVGLCSLTSREKGFATLFAFDPPSLRLFLSAAWQRALIWREILSFLRHKGPSQNMRHGALREESVPAATRKDLGHSTLSSFYTDCSHIMSEFKSHITYRD